LPEDSLSESEKRDQLIDVQEYSGIESSLAAKLEKNIFTREIRAIPISTMKK
jgi:hypothetical protein